MAVLTSTGVAVALVAAEPATFDNAGFSALSFVDFGHLTNVPEFGPNVQVVELNELALGYTTKYKGFINYGSVALEAAFDDTDAGQLLIEAGVTGADKNTEHSFRLTYPDGSIRYWTGKIFSYTENPGSANSMVMTGVNVEINTPILKIAAP